MTAETDAAGMSNAELAKRLEVAESYVRVASYGQLIPFANDLREAARRLAQGEGPVVTVYECGPEGATSWLGGGGGQNTTRPAADVRERVARLVCGVTDLHPDSVMSEDPLRVAWQSHLDTADAIIALLAQPDARKAALEEVADGGLRERIIAMLAHDYEPPELMADAILAVVLEEVAQWCEEPASVQLRAGLDSAAIHCRRLSQRPEPAAPGGKNG